MTTTQRTDIHRPTEMDPENYEFVAAFDNQQEGGWVLSGGDWALAISQKIARDDRLGRSVHQCHHCGARIRYFAVLKYTPSGEYIVVGETCLDNRFSLVSKREFDRLRKAAALDRQAQRIKTAAAEFVGNLSDSVARKALARETDLAAEFGLEDGYALSTITDIRRKIWNVYGNASDRQVEFVTRLIAQDAERRVARAAQAEEVKVPAPVGRVTLEGVVVSRKWKDSEYGGSMKITVKVTTPEGVWLAWMSEPAAIETERGDIIRVTATLSPSDNAHFAFGKRPSKAEIIGRTSVEADALADPEEVN